LEEASHVDEEPTGSMCRELKVEALGFPDTLEGPVCITRCNNPKVCLLTLQKAFMEISFSRIYHQNLVPVLDPFTLL
jgi:hypothetical protein